MRTLLAMFTAAMLAAWPAGSTTIYFAGGEDTSFTPIVGASGAAQGITGGSYLSRSGLARNTSTVVAVFNSNNVADPPASRLQTPTFASVSSLWIHFEFYILSTIANTSGQQSLIVRSPDGVSRIILRETGTGGQMKISKRNAAGTITDLATFTGNYPLTTVTAFDMNIVYGCTAGDSVTVYYAGVVAGTFTGASICTDAATTLNQVELAQFNGGSAGSVTTAGTGYSEVIISDSDTRGMALWTLAPVAAGNTQSWTPNTVANVNPGVINDTNFVTTGTSNALSEWTTPTTTPAGTWGVLAVVQEARVLRGTTGPQNFDFLVRTKDGTDHTGGFSSTILTSFSNFSSFVWATNPQTAIAWVTTDIATGFNLGIKSLP